MTDVQQLRRELVSILNQLDELPTEAVAERIALKNRRHELRARMAEALRSERRSSASAAQDLRAELQRLRLRREVLLGQRTSAAAGASGSGMGSGSVAQFQELRMKQDGALGIGELTAKISELEWELAQLEEHGTGSD